MWLPGTATRRRLARASGGLLGSLVFLSACRPPATTQAPTGAVDQPESVSRAAPRSRPQSVRLPEPGVYVLRLAKGVPLPADLMPRGAYDSYERVLAGWLYLTPDSIYKIMSCADLVDSTGRVPNTLDGGPSEGRYWAAGGRVYFSDPVADAMPDSIPVRVHGDTLEFVRDVYVRDRTSVIPRSLVAAFICAPVRASLERGARPKPSGVNR
jgi:hypothetical protein